MLPTLFIFFRQIVLLFLVRFFLPSELDETLVLKVCSFSVEVYNSILLENGGLKLRSFNKDQISEDFQRQRNDNENPYHQLGHGDDLRLSHSNYHVSNPSNKDW